MKLIQKVKNEKRASISVDETINSLKNSIDGLEDIFEKADQSIIKQKLQDVIFSININSNERTAKCNFYKFPLLNDLIENRVVFNGAEGRNRTDTMLPSADFESAASTNFTTPAHRRSLFYFTNRYLFLKRIANNQW